MRWMQLTAGAIALGLAGTAGPALGADAATFDYLEARYTVLGELDTRNRDADMVGLGLEGSRAFSEYVFVRLVSDMYDVERNNGPDAPLDVFSVGPGVRVPLNAPGTVMLWGQLNYERISLTGNVGTGFGLDAGVRVQLTEQIDAGFTLKSASTEADSVDIDYETWEFEGAWSINERIDLTASLVNGEVDVDPGTDRDLENLVRLGVRLPF